MSGNPPTPSSDPATNAAQSRWLDFLKSTGGAALITVLTGGIIGSLLSEKIQARKAKSDLSLLAYKEYLENERKHDERVHAEIGKLISATESLFTLTRPEFDPTQIQEVKKRQALEDQKTRVRHEFNVASADWRRDCDGLGFLTRYYHHTSAEPQHRWDELRKSVDDLQRCAEQWYEANRWTYSEKRGCEKERSHLDETLLSFDIAVETTRHYPWEESGYELKVAQTPGRDLSR